MRVSVASILSVWLVTRCVIAQEPGGDQTRLDLSAVPFAAVDGDRDGRLTPSELSGREATSQAPAPLLPRHQRAFEAADNDGDGVLNSREYENADDAAAAAAVERWLSQNAWPRFLQLDRDATGGLDLDEALRDVDAPMRGRQRRDFGLADFDGDNQLVFAEYLCLSDSAPPFARGPVPDPIVDRMEAALVALERGIRSADRDGNGAWSEREWPEAEVAAHISSARDAKFNDWDRDKNAFVDAAELRFRTEVCWGVRHETGPRLRHETGRMLFWRGLHERDRDHDLVLSEAEAGSITARDLASFQQELPRLDRDSDGRLSLGELVRGGSLLWRDAFGEFRRIDADWDGFITPQELWAQTPAWDRSYLDQLFPAFDEDRDGRLSCREFLGSPSGNPYRNWRPRDADGDGRVTPEEYHGSASPLYSTLSRYFFQQLDQDGDGLLPLREVEFDADLDRIAPELLVETLDRSGDARLTAGELFGREETPESPYLGRHLRLFAEADGDRDGLVDAEDVLAAEGLTEAALAERGLWKGAWPAFRKLDVDGDGALRGEEPLAGVETSWQAERRREVRLADFDADGRLTFEEYLCLPGVVPLQRRGTVPDPIAARSDEELSELTALLSPADADGDGAWSGGEWSVAVGGAAVAARLGSDRAAFEGWDGNGDGRVTRRELRRRVEVHYAVRQADGFPLRRPTGQVFNRRTFLYTDENADGQLQRAEFLAHYWKSGTAAEADFAAADRDADGTVSAAELGGSHLFWNDTLAEFKRFDSDGDGRIDAEELATRARPHEAEMAAQVFPAFDTAGDGGLSFAEFRGTPLANPVQDWNRERWDKDKDGQLSPAEYQGTEATDGAGLAQLFFARLDRDRNGQLSLAEARFNIDLSRAPPATVFAALDANRDARLTAGELLAHFTARSADAADERQHQTRLMELEDAFQVADRDRDATLSEAEFVAPEGTIAAVVAGRRAQAARGGTTVASAARSAGRVNLRLIALVAFNVLVIAALGWAAFRGVRSS
jgi:Ca2+-binding EF-hand superfamily protein